MAGVLAGGRDVYAYFNNDVGGHAPRNALTLRRLLDARPQRQGRAAARRSRRRRANRRRTRRRT
jgi:uncharacterized protein YecE (DUF72 family)